jgi:type I restriction enzyme S subunit
MEKITEKKIPEGYKMTEVGIIPDDWNLSKVSSLFNIVSGSTPSTSVKRYWGSSIPWFTPADMSDDIKYLVEPERYISNEGLHSIGDRSVPKGHIILSTRAPIGYVGVSVSKTSFNQGCKGLIAGIGVDSDFAYYIFSSIKLRLEKLSGGSTFSEIGKAELSKVNFEYPSLSEQKAIAKVLSDIDHLVVSLEKLVNKKEQVKKGTMQDLLTGERRLPGFSDTWKKTSLESILKYQQPTPFIVSSSEYTDTGKTPVLTAGKTFILGYTSEKEGIYTEPPVIIFDDFTTAVKYVDFNFKVKSSAMKILSVRNNKDHCLGFIFHRMVLLDFHPGEHKRHWISEYSKIELDIPDIVEQESIYKVINEMDKEIRALRSRLKKYKAIAKGASQQLLTGKIRLV